ncbi:MAG: hypothetical protein Q4G68_01895 [Planctomycetia bacterium]|nr:hypothetical protein [Planctomycetia bacterium]
MAYYKPVPSREPEATEPKAKASSLVQFLRILFITIPLLEIICFVEGFTTSGATETGATISAIYLICGFLLGLLALVTCTISIAIEKAVWIRLPLYLFWVVNGFMLFFIFVGWLVTR